MKPRAWLVDLDGTLYHSAPVRLAIGAQLALSGPAALAPLRAFRREHEQVRLLDDLSGASPFALQVSRAAQRVGMEPSRMEHLVWEWMVHRPGRWLYVFRRRWLIRQLVEHRNEGGRIAVVSDYPARAKLEALRLLRIVDTVVASGEEDGPARLKPAPDGCLEAARRLGLDPSECLVVGDRPDADGEAARRAGMAFRRITFLDL